MKFKVDQKISKKLGKVAVFIDVANLEHSAKELNIRIRYKKLAKFFSRKTKLVKINFYSARFNTKSQNNFFTLLKKTGYRLVTKQLKHILDNKKGHLRKANFDVEITVDAMMALNEFDTMVLFSGDSDFEYLIKQLKKLGKKVLVISTRHHISRELIESCHKYIDVRELKEIYEKSVGAR